MESEKLRKLLRWILRRTSITQTQAEMGRPWFGVELEDDEAERDMPPVRSARDPPTSCWLTRNTASQCQRSLEIAIGVKAGKVFPAHLPLDRQPLLLLIVYRTATTSRPETEIWQQPFNFFRPSIRRSQDSVELHERSGGRIM